MAPLTVRVGLLTAQVHRSCPVRPEDHSLAFEAAARCLKEDLRAHNRERVIALFGDSQQFALPATGAEEPPIPNQDLKNRDTCKLNNTSNHPPAVGTLSRCGAMYA
jgi:hypothetical protein